MLKLKMIGGEKPQLLIRDLINCLNNVSYPIS